MKSSSYLPVLLGVTALLGAAKLAMANGGHVHLGGIFFLLLGGLVFVVGIGVVFYLLLRPNANDSDPDANDFDDAGEEDIY
jgi:predicted membrane channel-forming protein YqfA (hemolysin III family)